MPTRHRNARALRRQPSQGPSRSGICAPGTRAECARPRARCWRAAAQAQRFRSRFSKEVAAGEQNSRRVSHPPSPRSEQVSAWIWRRCARDRTKLTPRRRSLCARRPSATPPLLADSCSADIRRWRGSARWSPRVSPWPLRRARAGRRRVPRPYHC
ncbi:hypothetical protein T492DRAFT_1060071 [Pavlovales sp. CCMP2436]|nr:hypothetical protein T492DRAFT_1060071 [Pavlovales sp. CCMP2436]